MGADQDRPGGATHHRAPGPFRKWSRGRPVVGAVLILLGGVEMFFSGQLDLGNIRISFGIEGLQATVIPAVLVLLGVLVALMPQHRVFYGVIAMALAVYSLIGVNLGGFVVGMLLAAIGGLLAVTWAPRGGGSGEAGDSGVSLGGGTLSDTRTDESSSTVDTRPGDDPGATSPERSVAGRGTRRATRRKQEEPPGGMRRERRRAGSGTVAALVIGAMTGGSTLLGATPANAAGFCIPIPLIVTCPSDDPAPSTTATPTPTAPTTTGAPGSEAGAGGSTASDDAAGADGSDKSDKSDESDKSDDHGTAAASAAPDPTWGAPTPADGLVVTQPAAQLSGTSIELAGLRGLSLVRLPLAGGGTTTAIRLSADDVAMNGFSLDVRGSATGTSAVTTDDRMELRGNVDIYLDSATLTLEDGKHLTIGADTPPPGDELPTASLRFTLGLVGATADSIRHTGSSLVVRPGPDSGADG